MRFVPRPDQAEAIDAIVRELVVENRTQAIMACGTGKTFVSQKAAERITADMPESLVLVAVPNLVLVEQMIGEWTRQAAPGHKFIALAVNSRRRGKVDPDEITEVDLTDVTSDPEEIAEFMLSVGRKVIFSTYQSMAHISKALELASGSQAGFELDLLILDEAHRTAGIRKSETPTAFKLALDNEKVPAAKRLFMTATPRISSMKRSNDDVASASMDNPVLFGERAITRSLSWAVTNDLLAPYRTYVVQVDNAMLQGVLTANPSLRVGGQAAEAKHVAAAIALAKNAKLNRLGGIVTYSSSIASAVEFGRVLEEVVAALPEDQKPAGKLTVNHINGGTPAEERNNILSTLDSTVRAPGDWSVVTNCNCLVEGVNVPSMDAIMFVDPRKSIVSIVQAIGRPMRKDKNNPGKIATIVVPVFIGGYENAQEAIEDGAFESIGQTITALRDVDDALSEKFVEHLVKRGFEDDEGAEAQEQLEVLIAFTDSDGELLPGQPENALIMVMDPAEGPVTCYEGVHEMDWNKWHRKLESVLVDEMASVWERGFASLKRFVDREGHAIVPADHMEEEHKLGRWVVLQRAELRRGTLSSDRISALSEVDGWVWSPKDTFFEDGLAALKKFIDREGHARIPNDHIEDGVSLGKWISTRRIEHKLNSLSYDRYTSLDSVAGWTWAPYESAFDEGFAALKKFAEREGHALVPGFCIEDGFPLGGWVSSRRWEYNRGSMSDDRYKALCSVEGWCWNPLQAAFEDGLAALKKFVAREGSTRVPSGHVEDGIRLSRWASKKRSAYKSGSLSADCVKALSTVDGWDWNPKDGFLDSALEALNKFVAREGHARVPYKHVEDGHRLGAWVSECRKGHSSGTLDDETVSLLSELDGWVWNILDASFTDGLAALKKFVAHEGHARVPNNHVEDGHNLGAWVVRIRGKYNNGTLSDDRSTALGAFTGWVWNTNDAMFEDGLTALKKFVAREGHAGVPTKHVEEGHSVGVWVAKRRASLKAGKLSEDRIAALDVVSLTWRIGSLAPWESAPGVRRLDEAA